MKVRAYVKVTGSRSTKDNTITLYKNKKTYSIKDNGAITADRIMEMHRHIIVSEGTRYNRYTNLTFEIKILKAEITN